MRIEDIANRFLLMSPDLADTIAYTYDGSGYITKEVRTISRINNNTAISVTKIVTITYTRNPDGTIATKTINIDTQP